MKKFWTWYDELATSNPTLRFGIFMGVVVIPGCLIIPISFYFTRFGLDAGQLVGLCYICLTMLSRMISMRTKSRA